MTTKKKAKAKSSKKAPAKYEAINNYIYFQINHEANMDLLLPADVEILKSKLQELDDSMLKHNTIMLTTDLMSASERKPILAQCDQMEIEIDLMIETVNMILQESRKIKEAA